jgi:hypothetical protein
MSDARRFELIEFEDRAWLPNGVRDALTDYLQFVCVRFRPYDRIVPHLRAALDAADAGRIIDLCSGGGGPWLSIAPHIQGPMRRRVWLTDKFPNRTAFAQAQAMSGDTIAFLEESIDATALPPGLSGFRTLFTAFHHFPQSDARAILSDAVNERRGIGIFEFTKRSPAALLWMLGTPLLVAACTPFIRPFRWSRLMWTYCIPLVPLTALADGLVSCWRSYSVEELRTLVSQLPAGHGYRWEIGELPAPFGLFGLTYLIGYPG